MIKIKNAEENNLKNISLNIPKNKITSFIGVSGSGKSSLIYNVLANEAIRREKIDSGNAICFDYAIRSKFDEIKNLPYCIPLKQRAIQQSISSTIATITKLHEILREEFVKYGQIISQNGYIVSKPDAKTIKTFMQIYHKNSKYDLFAIICFKKYTDGQNELNFLCQNNIKEAIFISSYDEKEKIKKISTSKSLNSNYKHTILLPIKNIEEIESYQDLAKESFLIKNKNLNYNFYYDYPDIYSGKTYQKKSTELLSFNSISQYSGKCEQCLGHGKIDGIDFESLILKEKKLDEYFLDLEDNKKGCYKYILLCNDSLNRTFKSHKIDTNKTFYDLNLDQQQIIKDIISPKIIKHKNKPSIGKYVKSVVCDSCNGTRLNYKANAVKLFGKNISEILNFTVDELYDFFKDKKLHHKKIFDILKALKQSTLGYLTLNRTTDTLSGGELQRLKFAIELVSEYKNLLYILDEPSTGLHPYNNHQMINLIKHLRDKGNTVVISEHNQDYIKNSDYVFELGYGSGKDGGEIIFEGFKKETDKNSIERKKIDISKNIFIELINVNSNNIKNENFKIPLKCLVAISGVSGSGKSSLVHNVLSPCIKQYIYDKSYDKSLVKEIKNIDEIKSIFEMTQSQIGINSRSIVATYLNIFDKIRDTFASLDISKELGLEKGHFSFNSVLGACETCKGMGEVENLICPSCLGQRYKPEVLEIKINGYNIFEILNIQIEKLDKIFQNKTISEVSNIFNKLGLSHINLGRTTPTLSGGEAQRLKFAKVLIENYTKIKKGNFLFILDEPTSGLSEKDTPKLYTIFDEIISYNNSIIVVEHNQELLKNSDYIIDIGLGSASMGGKNIFSGRYEDLIKHPSSLTAKAFNNSFENIENIKIDNSQLLEKIYDKNKINIDCNKFYLDEEHFKIEKNFAKNYEVLTDEVNHKYFKTKTELFDFANKFTNCEISFNPYTTELNRYKKVPLSLKKDKIKNLKKLGFNVNTQDYKIDVWKYRVPTDNMEKAYNFGNGWISIRVQDKNYELFTRLVSAKNEVVGVSHIDEKTFNLYLNSCIYCNGTNKKDIYDIDLIITNKKLSILDTGFFHSNIKFNLKSIISRFEKEELFDISKPFTQLSKDEQNIFLFGFKEYEFLKKGGRVNAKSDYIKWQGIYFYVYEKLNKIDIKDKIIKSKHKINCPFCSSGFKKEVKYYIYDNKNIVDIINKS